MLALRPIDVSIIIVSYNTRAMTEALLTSLKAQTRSTAYEVIVVDNASSDGSADMIAAHPLAPTLIALSENIGFARANNLAGLEARGRYVLLLNPDTVVLDFAIDRLVAFAAAQPQARIWGGRTVFADGRLNQASCWSRMTVWSLLCRATGLAAIFPKSNVFNSETMGGWQRDSIRHVDIVSGCFFLIDRDLWAGLRGFDPMFFMYGEEADFCLRARSFSARPLITPDATIVHHGGASERVRTEKMIRLLAAKASLIERHWNLTTAPIGRALLAAWPLSRLIATTVQASIFKSASAVEAAATWRTIWHRRHEWQAGYNQLTPHASPRIARKLTPDITGYVRSAP